MEKTGTDPVMELRWVSDEQVWDWARVTNETVKGIGPSVDAYADVFLHEIAEKRRTAFLAWRDGRPVGRLRLRAEAGQADAWGLGLLPEAVGFGPELGLALEAEARRLGCKSVKAEPVRSQVAWFTAAGYTLRKTRAGMRARLAARPVTCDRTLRHPRSDDPAEVEALGRLLLEGYTGTIDYEGETPEQALTEARRLVGGFFGEFYADCSYLVVGRDGEPAGAAFVTRDTDGVALLAEVVVHPAHRGHGYARPLIQSAMNACLERGIPEMVLAVTLGNVPAEGLYRRMGFRPEGELEYHLTKELDG